MTLLTFKHSGQEESDIKYKTGITGRRWALTLEQYSLGLFHQIQYEYGKYIYGIGYYLVSITKNWQVGYSKHKYDGWHKSFSLGFIHFCWWSM